MARRRAERAQRLRRNSALLCVATERHNHPLPCARASLESQRSQWRHSREQAMLGKPIGAARTAKPRSRSLRSSIMRCRQPWRPSRARTHPQRHANRCHWQQHLRYPGRARQERAMRRSRTSARTRRSQRRAPCAARAFPRESAGTRTVSRQHRTEIAGWHTHNTRHGWMHKRTRDTQTPTHEAHSFPSGLDARKARYAHSAVGHRLLANDSYTRIHHRTRGCACKKRSTPACTRCARRQVAHTATANDACAHWRTHARARACSHAKREHSSMHGRACTRTHARTIRRIRKPRTLTQGTAPRHTHAPAACGARRHTTGGTRRRAPRTSQT